MERHRARSMAQKFLFDDEFLVEQTAAHETADEADQEQAPPEPTYSAAERIKALMFTFEDLHKLDPTGIQTLLRNCDKDKLGIALKGASEELRDLFFSNMSERAGKILREDMENMGPVRLKDVDEAQGFMVLLAKDLSARGEIIISEGGGEEELIY